MSDIRNYTKAFAKALFDHLANNVPKFTTEHWKSVGCSTCGDGIELFDVDMERLEQEIDAFAASFNGYQS